MRAYRNHKIWFLSFLLLIVTTGCSDPDDFSGNATLTSPQVGTVTPPNGNAVVCPSTSVISATFSKAMNPATINGSTFIVTGPGGAGIDGTVGYVAATNMATFTPAVPGLALDTSYTATLTTGVMDPYGHHLAANFEWSFTTPVVACPPAAALPPLATACTFGGHQHRPQHRFGWRCRHMAVGCDQRISAGHTHRHETHGRCGGHDRPG